MPPPSTPKRSSNHQESKTPLSKAKSVDAGLPLGIYDTNSVRDRVRQWQSQGGGVITASEGHSEDGGIEVSCQGSELKVKEIDNSPNTEEGDMHSGGCEKICSRKGGRKLKVVEERRDRTRSGSAPAKRVVSDAHWRTKRSPPRSATSSKPSQGNLSKDVSMEDGTRAKPAINHKRETRRRRQGDKAGSREGAVEADDGIRVFPTPPGSYKQSENMQMQEHGDPQGMENNDVEAVNSKSPSSHASLSAKQSNHPTPKKSPALGSFAAKEHARRRKSSYHKENMSNQGEIPEGRGSIKSKNPNMLSQVFGDSRNIFSKSRPTPISAPRVPSIEAWLNETSDPFIDCNDPITETTTLIRSGSEKVVAASVETPVEDPNKIWDSLGHNDSTEKATVHGSKRRKRIKSSAIYEDNPFPADFNSESPLSPSPNGIISTPKLVDLVQSTPETSSTSLKRRGARKSTSSPSRDRPKTVVHDEPFAEFDESSALSSNITASSVEAPDPELLMRPLGLRLKRPFPSTGHHRLSTIASVETFNTQAQNAPVSSLSETPKTAVQSKSFGQQDLEAEARDQFDLGSLARSASRLTKHADLISVLSLPRAGTKSIQSARSIRTNRSRLATATIGDIMKELAMDESKYMRELRTLVDGVIPVLLNCVLSKSDSAVAAGLFSPSSNAKDNPSFTKPIVDMGIALERLKALHKRMPHQDVKSLLTWTQGAQRVYVEYLKAWRMGFQDVVVNLAPAVEDDSPKSRSPVVESDGLDEGLPRNQDGDVVNGDGERVDVAFLLKRPLVRLKYLAKTLKGINFINPSSEAETLATKYQNLVIDARNRSNEERARLEDEAASNIDATRSRDPRTLAPLTGVTIDKTRRVRARDHFNLALQHSSGQCLDCRIELLLRDDPNGVNVGGDLLICEVERAGRWLLFPPVQVGRVSARNGDLKGEIVLMMRGIGGQGLEWQELLSLRTDDEQAGFEWVQMLGLIPVPPKIARSRSFLKKHARNRSFTLKAPSALEPPITQSTLGRSRTPSPTEIEIPIGEQASQVSKTWSEKPVNQASSTSPKTSSSRERARLQRKPPGSPRTPPKPPQNYVDEVSDLRSLPSQSTARQTRSPDQNLMLKSPNEAVDRSASPLSSTLKRTKAKRLSRHADSSPVSPRSTKSSDNEGGFQSSSVGIENIRTPPIALPDPKDKRSLSPEPQVDCSPSSRKPAADGQKVSSRPSHRRSQSSVPSAELPTIPKVRKDSLSTRPIDEPDEELDWEIPAKASHSSLSASLNEEHPIPLKTNIVDSSAPPIPVHSSPSTTQIKGAKTPMLDAKPSRNVKRRSSSPLKHEYEPSTASETSSDSETSTIEHNEATSISESSDDDFGDGDSPDPLLPLGIKQPFPKASPEGSLYSLPNGTLSPSQSASQAPYKTVPSQPMKASKTIASIFSWSDKGFWESLHTVECSIVVTPGLIEAYEMSAAHSKNMPSTSSTPALDADKISELSSNPTALNEEPQNGRPLVALELTPLVPLRRGTALDISIRSPPTATSQITSGNNIMFRSRNPEECETLYALINHSRINNPTYVALQNARGPYVAGPFFSPLDRRGSNRANSFRTSSWFGGLGRSSSYRASSAPTPSIAPSESSIGSMASAFSALKRFGKGASGGGIFNIARSTISSRDGSRTNSVYTGSENSSGSGASSPIPSSTGDGTAKVAPIGLSNAKIRLYIRETASRWRDMGSARLTITRPINLSALAPGTTESIKPSTGRGDEKRIIVNGKTKGEVLLDVQLGESCFERVARTGIALSVWEDVVGPNGEIGVVGAVGGVGGGRARVYMIQVC